MQASTNTQAPSGRRSRRGSRVLLAVLAALVVSLFVLLESGKPSHAIIGGDTANHNPGMVALMYHWDATDPDPTNPDPKVHPNGPNPYCGGTLIDADSVLTAAHCLYYPQKDAQGNPHPKAGQRLDITHIEVIAGATRLFAGRGVVRDVTETQVPDLYRPDSLKYDVAVLTLNQPAPNPKELSLATGADDPLEKAKEAVVAGWGLTQPCSETLTRDEKLKVCRPEEQLHWARVAIRSDLEAGHLILQKEIKFSPELMVAAGDKQGEGACGGDSGGPLFVENETYTRGTIIGVAAHAPCGERDVYAGQPPFRWKVYKQPDVYTEVNNPSIRTFIVNHMR
jgi:trypsin